MNTTTTTNATNGAIITVTHFQRTAANHNAAIFVACLAVSFIALGLYLLLKKPKTKRP